MEEHKGIWIVAGLLVLLIAVIGGMELLKRSADPILEASTPKSLVTTFKDDPMTSRAFTWHTERTDLKSVVQLIEGKYTDKSQFEEQNVITVEGESSTIEVGGGVQQGVHKVNVVDLQPSTTYTYRVGSGEASEWSELAVFQTQSEDLSAFTFINVTDSQGKTEQDFELWGKTLDKAFELFPDAQFIVHNGDLTDDPKKEASWDFFFSKAKQWVTRIPLMPVTGNHDEIDKDADRYASHFYLPDNGSAKSNPGTTYSFDYGPVHFVVLNTESKVKDQTEWLRKDLASTDKPWKIVALHDGPYGGSQEKSILKRWVPVFDEYEVDLVLQGHNHEYVRSKPMRNDQVVEENEGTIYVVTHSSGSKFNEKKDDLYYHEVHFKYTKQVFAAVQISGDTLTFQAYDISGQPIDEFTIVH